MTEQIIDQLWKEFGRRIRIRREELRLTQEDAGARAGMRRQQWHRIEQGASTKRTTIVRIAKALELDLDEVLHWAGFQKETLKEKTLRRVPAPAGAQFVSGSGFSVDELLLHYFHSLPAEIQSGALAYLGSLYLKYQTPEAAKALEEKMAAQVTLRLGDQLEDVEKVREG